ncbi:hypothetical protein J7T55_010315 [Diaporthe amygdali]|uniref:uncharacterized protein n=1 Tax=Phomopsis amygdali TaxID=1214568 RepID=UPI0022FEA6D1|nr:uncharacterized protein J7T55_010315 [Diaporthe amygdali]KAJ0107708.1 hypothetical protein J7T55_010315 [Diaporthe amygdali]
MQGNGSDSTGPSPKGTSLETPQCACCDFVPSPNQDYKNWYDYEAFDLDYKALKESAECGHCGVCVGMIKFLKAQLEPTRFTYHIDEFGDLIPAFTFNDEMDPPSYELFTINNGSAGDLRLKRSYGKPRIPRMRVPSGDTSSIKAFDTLKHWISRCQAEHTHCQPTADKTLPHRLLEIKSINPLSVRVVENCTLSKNYACLSHRWADERTKSVSLTKNNLDLFKAEVPEDNFYPLMRDAIVATFELDVRLIWIDCYCIIQDDEEDWKKESAEMGSIYENAFFTISATSSNGGCSMFSTISEEFVAFQVAEIQGKPVYIRKQISHPCIVDYDKYAGAERLRGPSLARAWIFQERVLSNRFIHFTSDELFWECRESTWCECGSIEEQWKEEREVRTRTLGDQVWDHIAEQYNDTQLTLEKDRLPALAGLARRYAELHGKKAYLAGLWEDDLPSALAWEKVAWHEPRPLKQVTPTWSWTSQPYGKELVSTSARRSGRLVKYRMNPPDADVYAGAESTEITVEAPMLDLTVYKHEDEGLIGRLENGFLRIWADFKTDPDDTTKYRTVPDGSRCLLLLLLGDADNNDWGHVYGIVLLQQNSDAHGEAAKFERIGYFNNYDGDYCYLDESGEFAEYCGGSFPPFAVPVDTWPAAPVQWLMDRAETRQVTLV